MKKITIVLLLTAITALNAWELMESSWSEEVQTNLIRCEDNSIKAVYYTHEKGKYELTPTIFFDTLEEAAAFICKSKQSEF
jgi:hypothetical protein